MDGDVSIVFDNLPPSTYPLNSNRLDVKFEFETRSIREVSAKKATRS